MALWKLPHPYGNMLTLCCSCPLFPLACLFGKLLKVNIFDKSNPLNSSMLVFTFNQFLYLLIVMWAIYDAPGKMIMLYAMIVGAHFLPFSWLYRSISYRVFAIAIPLGALILGCLTGPVWVALAMIAAESALAVCLFREVRRIKE